HLRTLSKIHRGRPQRLSRSRRSNLPEGAAHHTAVSVAVNTSSTSVFRRAPPVQQQPPWRAAHYAHSLHVGEAAGGRPKAPVQEATSETRAKVRLPTWRTPWKPGFSTRWASSTTPPSIRTARSR